MEQKTKVAINGFGRIGRAFLKLALEKKELEVVAINDLGDLDNLAYLLKYDSAYGRADFEIETQDKKLIVNGHEINFIQEKDPANLPWNDLNVDIVIESTGFFEEYSKAAGHIKAGAKKVVISAPAKGEPADGINCGMVLLGINDNDLKELQISSNASCTTNAIGAVIAIMKESVGVNKAVLNTIHAYTASQKIVDSPDAGDWRRGRAGANNAIPSTTGAARAVGKIITDIGDKFDGLAIRIPVISGSLADVTFVASRPTNVEEINDIFEKATQEERWKNILGVTREKLVSTDIIGNTLPSIVDLSFTKVIDGDLVKVLAWYDNEMGYTRTLVNHVILAGKYLK
ncbi:MAG TPA: type I glyceraldehyde-3-phosphate dehydrogenase [Candidatus Vogelbacteria bacterium]|nr:type I glyceraldehyde-3-phosphate dehydrogenase [Candidatus Vogelbacteria bacterium]